jgi:hypothetical protein
MTILKKWSFAFLITAAALASTLVLFSEGHEGLLIVEQAEAASEVTGGGHIIPGASLDCPSRTTVIDDSRVALDFQATNNNKGQIQGKWVILNSQTQSLLKEGYFNRGIMDDVSSYYLKGEVTSDLSCDYPYTIVITGKCGSDRMIEMIDGQGRLGAFRGNVICR